MSTSPVNEYVPGEVRELTPGEYEMLKHKLQTTVITNVFTEEEFKTQFLIVFKKMSDILSRTLGPYGAGTMIDQQTNYSVTKDGFHVLENLRFADTKMNRIRSTLYSISHQMVTKVGDGSTSAVVAAYAFLLEMLDFSEKHKQIRPKELNERIQRIVDKICAEIAKRATPITQENLLDSVRNIANIATNENTLYTDMITEIYKTLGPNCNINLQESKTYENTVEYEDGVYSNDNYLVDSIYHNRGDRCLIKDPAFLLFDHTLDTDIWPIFEVAFNKFCYRERRTLIVIAPFYDQFLMDKMRKDAEEMVRTYSNRASVPFRVIFLKSNLTKPIAKDMYRDLAALLGATIIQPPDSREVIKALNDYAKACTEARADGKMEDPGMPEEIEKFVKDHLGFCESANMGDRNSSFKGFTNKNEALFNALYHDAEIHLKEEESRVLRNDSIDNKVFDARIRFSKINCKSATITVGGSNKLEMTLNVDAVDDAIKACASAIKYGYNLGCNLAIIQAIDKLHNKQEVEDEVDATIYNGLRAAFISVYRVLLTNGMPEEEANAIIEKSVETGMCYDMVNHTMDTDGKIINSCRTDIEILKGAIAMVAVVLTCNQYISITLNN